VQKKYNRLARLARIFGEMLEKLPVLGRKGSGVGAEIVALCANQWILLIDEY
jgi:hypothetical protein